MKRFIITIAMSFMLFFTAMAGENNTQNTEAYNITVNTEKLSNSLSASKDQAESIYDIMKIFSAQMDNAKLETNDSTRSKMVDNTIAMNINYMRQVLSDEQYKKYLTILNSTLRNRGLK